jgi:hypothetical protein
VPTGRAVAANTCDKREAALCKRLDKGNERLHPDFPPTVTGVILSSFQIKLETSMNATQMCAMMEQLRQLLPGGEQLISDWNSLKRFIGCLGNMYDLIEQCRECGLIYFNYLDGSIQQLTMCPECCASR